MGATSKHHEYHGFACLQQLFNILLLFAWQTESLTIAVLTTKHHVLAYGSNDHIGILGHLQGLGFIGFLTRINLTVQEIILPSTSITHLSIFGLDFLSPVATTRIHHIEALGLVVLHAFKQFHDVGIVAIGHIHHHLPEVRHSWIGIVATHGPDRVGVRTCDENVLDILQRQHTVVLQQHHRLGGDIVGRLTLLGSVEFDILLRIQIGILIEETHTEFDAQHVLHGSLEYLRLYQTLVYGFLKELVVGTKGEVYIVAVVDGGSGLLDGIIDIGNLVDGGIVAYHHTVEAHIATKDILEDLTVGHTTDAMNIMVARHHSHTTRQTDHRLVGQQDLFHHLLLLCVATTAVAQVVLGTGTYTSLQVTLLQTLDEGCSHHGREIAVLAIGLFQTVETRRATHVDHR